MNRVRQVIEAGGLALGMYAGAMRGTEIVEIIGLADFDAVFVDMEHQPTGLREVQAMVIAAELAGITPMVRTPGLDAPLIARLLDLGVQGIQVPGITSGREAEAAVMAVRYPPVGKRGVLGYSRAAKYGSLPLRDHIERSNEDVILAVMLESREALEAADEISQVDGVDLLAIGPEDLAWSLGLTNADGEAQLAELIGGMAETARRHGRHLAMPLGHPAFPRGYEALRELGVAYANCGPPPERLLLQAMSEQVTAIRSEFRRA